jgi:signal transduction histidine kinase
MRYFLVVLTLVFCHRVEVNAQADEQNLIEHTLEEVNAFKINNKNDSALYLLITLNRTLKEMDQESGYIYIEIGNLYFQLRLDNLAKKFYAKASKIFNTSNDLIGKSIVLENYGGLHSRVNPGSDPVFYYYNEALDLQLEAGDLFYAAHSQRALALYYSRNDKKAEAHSMINRAIRTVQDPSIRQHPRYKWDVQFIPQQVYLAASDLYRNEKTMLDSAEYFLNEAIRMTTVYGIAAHRVRYKTFLGSFYLEQRQWPKALQAIQESLTLADSIGYVWGKVGALQVLRNYYHQTHDAKKETEAAYNYLLFKDQMYNERNNDDLIVMSNLILQYENEMEIERQQSLIKEKERINQYQRQQNYLLLGGLIGVTVALLSIILLYRSLRKKTRLAQQYLEELEVSNETMRTLLSVISHDVRSPFNSLLGLTRVTLMETELQTKDYRERITMMHDTSAKGLILLDNLLQWVALQRDEALIKKETIDVPSLIGETLHELSSVALTLNVTFEKNISISSYESDRNALKVIIRNLLTNAIKYSSGKKVFLDATQQDAWVKIQVTDQGPGIPEEIRLGLFSEGDMKKVAAKGGGLGMQIVKKLVVELRGEIHAHNLPEGGARFEVRLPLEI